MMLSSSQLFSLIWVILFSVSWLQYSVATVLGSSVIVWQSSPLRGKEIAGSWFALGEGVGRLSVPMVIQSLGRRESVTLEKGANVLRCLNKCS